jgi:ATP-binding protein involved in chromosome partitioning
MSEARRLPTYREVTGPDRSGILDQVTAQQARVQARLATVRHVVAVASGKGGVGKSWVAAQLARGLAGAGWRVGLLDADVNGPTVPRLAGAPRPPLTVADGAVQPAVTAEGVRVFSAAFLVIEGEPVRWREPGGDAFVWRGALEAGTLREMLADVAWGPLDVLLVDLPPGPARLADLHALVPGLTGVLAVTIPSAESADAVRRSLALARERGIPLLGLIENMAAHACPACGHTHAAFPGDAGAALAAEFGIACLARLPFDPGPDACTALVAAVRQAIADR